MGFLGPVAPYAIAAAKGAAATAGSMAVNKAGEAAFGGNAVSANQAPPPSGPGGMHGSPAMQILQQVQAQQQMEQQQHQQAILALLSQYANGTGTINGPIPQSSMKEPWGVKVGGWTG